MPYAIALVLAVALVAVVVSFGGIVRALVRQHARERDLLINQLLHATGNAWQPSPAVDAARAESRREPEEYERKIRFTPSPEQLPTA